MWNRGRGGNRKTLREGSGTNVEPEHYDEVLGSSEFYIYVAANKRLKGYDEFKKTMGELGVLSEFPVESPHSPGARYQAVKLSYSEQIIPDDALRNAHKWAHRRNCLHSFFKPW